MQKNRRKLLIVSAIVIAVYLVIGMYFSVGFVFSTGFAFGGYSAAFSMLIFWPALFIVQIH